MSHEVDAVVVGAGVSGLTSAILLAERGLRVLVRAAEAPPETTSCAAGAIWGPHMVSHEHALDWALESLAVFRDLAGKPSTGVTMVAGVEAGRAGVTVAHPGPGVEDVKRCDEATLPPPYRSGWHYRVPMIEMSRYLDYLTTRLLATDAARLEIGERVTAGELPALGPIVVNCTGLGARSLIPGDPVRPVRGDLLVLDNPGIDEFFIEQDDDDGDLTTYVLPQGDRVILGGSRRDGDWSTEPDPGIAADILRRCIAVEPRLCGLPVLDYRIGLRPVRPQVRIAVDETHPHVVHNYGHGGGGVTVSWGCAAEVVRLTAAAERSSRPR